MIPMLPEQTIHIPETPEPFLEDCKNRMLVCLYGLDRDGAMACCREVCRYVATLADSDMPGRPDEAAEKCLNQIQAAWDRFEKGPTRAETTLKRFLVQQNRRGRKKIRQVSLDAWEKALELPRAHLDLICKTAMTFQLSGGCSQFCRRCNEWALPGVRSHFTGSAVTGLVQRMVREKNPEIALYGASDPLDWEDGDRGLDDLMDALSGMPIFCGILTKVPRGKESRLVRLLENRVPLSVSVTARNKTRIQALEAELGQSITRQHDLPDLLIPARLDEDFVSVKPSITDGYGTEITPDGAFIIIPTFTSALYPCGHRKIRITRDTTFFPARKTGRAALLVDYFKPLQGYDLNQTPCQLQKLLEVQVETLILDTGADDLTPPGMRGIKEYLTIFDKPARVRRTRMTPSVLRHLRQEFLGSSSFSHLPRVVRAAYLGKIRGHLALCRPDACRESRMYALSFFLAAVRDYCPKHPVRTRILDRLLKNERQARQKTPERSVHGSGPDAFDTFRRWVHGLLKGRRLPDLDRFLAEHPAAYDPESDMFVRRPDTGI